MKLVAVMWDAYMPMLKRASKEAGVELSAYANRIVEENRELLDEILSKSADADVILFNRTTHSFWEELCASFKEIREKKPVICVGNDASYWGLTSTDKEIAIEAYKYLTKNSYENFRRLIIFLYFYFGDKKSEILPPVDIPFQGIVHPHAENVIFDSLPEYLDWYEEYLADCRMKTAGKDADKDTGKDSGMDTGKYVGVIISRAAWLSQNCEIESTLIRDLEDLGLRTIPVFTNSVHDDSQKSLNIAEVIRKYFFLDGAAKISATVKLTTFMIGKDSSVSDSEQLNTGVSLLKSMNIPVFQPIISYYATLEEWKELPGLTTDLAWSVAMPEFEGIIEPIMLGASRENRNNDYERSVIPGHSKKIAARVFNWIRLSQKKNAEKKIVFILNNNPCASVEANIGSAAHLDAAKSVVNILASLKDAGYNVGVPASAKELMDLFLEKKAISEFRWTTKSEIVRCGGALYQMSTEEYMKYFSALSESVQKRMIEIWGEPPGEGMVLDGRILITGLKFGNAIVAVQPKRGCFGAQCDGSVCKILHNPDCPPTHQYLAAYHYFESIYNADVFVHVGTHGNLEFLPGKGTALSEDCFPAITSGRKPLLYIYNTDNPPEGSIAKRRANATLIGHMQTAMTGSSLYGDYEKLDNLLNQYETAKTDPARAHALHHMILEVVSGDKFKNLNITHETPVEDAVRICHEALTLIRNTKIDSGMHVFGELPQGDKKADMIASILMYPYETGDSDAPLSLRDTVSAIFGLSYDELKKNPSAFNTRYSLSNGALIEYLYNKAVTVVKMTLAGATCEDILNALGKSPADTGERTVKSLKFAMGRINEINRRIVDSKEMDSLMNGLNGGYIPPGPSGLVIRGRSDVLPSGRNFYSLDPTKVPTTSAWRVGERLADALLDKYLDEEGKYPENVAFYWMCSDIMTADGEMMAEIFSLLGVVPVWNGAGQVKSFEVVPAEKLVHPRIDVTIRISGILRDNFMGAVNLVDSAIAAVSVLDESDEINYVKKHVAEKTGKGVEFSEATSRIFSAQPGAYTSGVNLAILAGAWKTEKDLAEIFIAVNGYAYGGSRNGKATYEQFASNLETVNVTFNKVVSDEHDLLGCCCYYGNQGGLTAAARYLSQKPVKAYYGDTREPEYVSVRTLADEVRRVVRTKLLNPKWIDGMKEHGYKGASDIMKRVSRVYGWEAATQEVDDSIFDDIADTFVNDKVMREFFEENNPYALEEISRRLLEAESRGLWQPNQKTIDDLKENYLEIESWLEEKAGDGTFQGGSVDVITADEVAGWGDSIAEVMKRVHNRR